MACGAGVRGADDGIGLVVDGPGAEQPLGGAEDALNLEALAIAQHDSTGIEVGVGPEEADDIGPAAPPTSQGCCRSSIACGPASLSAGCAWSPIAA